MNSCDCFIGDIVRPKGFILTDFYILGLPTGIGTMNKVSRYVILLVYMQCEQILGVQPLSDITREMEDIVIFLKGFSELSEIILELSECKLLVEWLQTDVKS